MGFVNRLAQATMAAVAMPALKPSNIVTQIQTTMAPPDRARKAKPTFETAARTREIAMAGIVPKRSPMRPATITPARVAGKPKTVRVAAISGPVKPRSI